MESEPKDTLGRSLGKRGPKLKLKDRKAIITALTDGTATPTELAEKYGVSQAAITPYVRRVQAAASEQVETAVIAARTDEELAESAQSDRAWLESFRNNPRLPASERVRAAIALERSSRGHEESAWKPPEDAEMWAECLAELVRAQPAGVTEHVIRLLRGSGNEPQSV